MTGESSSSSDGRRGAAAEPVIELRDVGIWYRRELKRVGSLRERLLRRGRARETQVRWALRHVDLTCREGQSWGIIGHNGAGKSTLCLLLANILVPDEGQAIVRGKVSALVSLGASFNPELSGRENILLYSAFLGTSRALMEEKLPEIVEFSELQDFIDEPMRAYSTGMRARLGFAVATSLEPEVLILDEVLSVGDLDFRAKSQAKIEALMATSRCIVTVSHSTSFLRQITTHCLWLERGEVQMVGASHEVLHAYEAATPEERRGVRRAP